MQANFSCPEVVLKWVQIILYRVDFVSISELLNLIADEPLRNSEFLSHIDNCLKCTYSRS